MLITKELEVPLNANNIKYFEKLGYKIPKKKDRWHKNKFTVSIGTKIKVKIEDLKKSSKLLIRAKCDNCGTIIDLEWRKYISLLDEHGKFYCTYKNNSCRNKILYSKENNPNWNCNITNEEREIKRNTLEYVLWVKKVLNRDNFTCKVCGKKSHENNLKIEAHHLDGYNWCKEKRYDETNGVTLCEKCHKNFHSKFGYGNNTKEQFDIWIGSTSKFLNYKGELPTSRKIYCLEEDKIYNSAEELRKEWGVKSITNIYRVCNHKTEYISRKNHGVVEYIQKTVNKKHILWLDEYINMSANDIKNYLNLCNHKINRRGARKVICKTTGKTFNSIKEASEYYNCNSAQITKCCKGYSKYAGKLINGEILEWEYYKKY